MKGVQCALLVAILAIAGGCSEGIQSPSSDDPLAAAAAKPNIIFLLADDQRADSLSVAGHPFVQTPHIDALAQEGTRFTQAFTVEPICAPSRFAFFSGQYERTSGLGFNSPYQVSEAQWNETYPALLQDAGYHTGFVGKFGVQYYQLDGGASAKFDYWRGHDGWLPFFPKDLPGNPATHTYKNAEKSIVTEIMGEYITDFLRSRPPDSPFSLSVSFSAPHNSIVSSMFPDGAEENCQPRGCDVMGFAANNNPVLQGHPFYGSLYRDSEWPLPSDVGADPYQFIPEGVIDHEARKQWYAYNYQRELQPEHLVRYHQTISGIDAVVGQLVSELEQQGIADNTIIIYASDHGLLNGEYGTGGKGLLYDLVARIPLIVYDPRAPASQRGLTIDDLVLSIDVPSTILTHAGLPIPQIMQGRALLSGTRLAPREEVFLESLTTAEGNPFIEAIRTQEWKYVRYLQPQGCPYEEQHLDFSDDKPIFEQLFRLSEDPAERVNLANDPRYASVLMNFQQRTRTASMALTDTSRRFKNVFSVPQRPAEGVYCW
ncbi:MAG: sulfatase-like hydrolase/transferase [Lysobacterales bacterium]